MDTNPGWTKRGELIAPNNYVYFFLFLYFVAHLAMMHYNQHQMSKLDIKGKKEYAIMTFITVYFTYFVVLPSLWFSYENQDKVIRFTVIIGSVLIAVYFIYTINFITKSLKKGVSKEQDKQRGFCIGSMLMTVFGFIILALVLFTRFSRARELKQRLEDMKPDNYEELIDKWFENSFDLDSRYSAEEINNQYNYITELLNNDDGKLIDIWLNKFDMADFTSKRTELWRNCEQINKSLYPESKDNCSKKDEALKSIFGLVRFKHAELQRNQIERRMFAQLHKSTY